MQDRAGPRTLTLWRPCQIAHHALKVFLIGIVILPAPEIADVSRAQLCRPWLVRSNDRIVEANGKQHIMPTLPFFLRIPCSLRL